jgi:hypothetical protein
MTTQTLRHDTYNVSSGRPFTNREFADALQAVTPGPRFDPLPGRQDGPGSNAYLDITRLTRDTGFTPAFDGKNRTALCQLRAADGHGCRFPLVRRHGMRNGAGKPVTGL